MPDSATEGRGGLLRGIAVLASAAVLLGIFALGPADAKRKGFTKKKALNLFYDKGGADARFEEEGDVLWAKVDSNGDLIGGEGITDTSREDQGDYLVTFNRPQDPCARLATVNDDTALIATADGWSDPNTVRVQLTDNSAAPIDTVFSVALFC